MLVFDSMQSGKKEKDQYQYQLINPIYPAIDIVGNRYDEKDIVSNNHIDLSPQNYLLEQARIVAGETTYKLCHKRVFLTSSCFLAFLVVQIGGVT